MSSRSTPRPWDCRPSPPAALALDPLNDGVRRNVVLTLTRTGHFAEALAVAARDSDSSSRMMSRRAIALVALGRRDSVEGMARRFRETARTPVDWYAVAFVEVALGNLDCALAAFERIGGAPSAAPEWKPLARDPRFLPLCRRRDDEATCARRVREIEALPDIPLPSAR